MKNKDFLITKSLPDLRDRFMKHAYPEPNTGCWLWAGALGWGGYGLMTINKRSLQSLTRRTLGAHRLSYELHKGPIPKGMFVCHSCDTRICVNPEHLWLGSCGDNIRDMVKKKRHAVFTGKFSLNNVKLTEEQVLEIRQSNDKGILIAKKFGVCAGTVSLIRSNKIWKLKNKTL